MPSKNVIHSAKVASLFHRAAEFGIDAKSVEVSMKGLSETRGFLKMLIDADSNRILGFTAFGAEGGELMAVVQTAILNKAPFTFLRDAIFTHPTMAEGLVGLLSNVEVIPAQ